MANYITLFNNENDYRSFNEGQDFTKPNTSHCIDENHVHYSPYDFSDRYLTFVALEDGATFTFNGTSTNVASYSVDGGETWTEIASGVSTPSIDTGEKILWKGQMIPVSDDQNNIYGIGKFTSSKKFDAEGNVM